MKLSIIIPALNEAAGIEAVLQPLQAWRAAGVEVIVVDGGSGDTTVALAQALADRVIAAPRGRACQMNAGAAAATGEAFAFLHADTILPESAPGAILAALCIEEPPAPTVLAITHMGNLSGVIAGDGAAASVHRGDGAAASVHRGDGAAASVDRGDGAAASVLSWGRFDVSISGAHPLLRVIAWCMNLRSRLTGIATGDQALFMTRAAFAAVGGFPDQPLMEDIEISRRLKRLGAPVCLADKVTTSGRRWERRGVWRTVLLMWRLRLAYFFGASPEYLAARYR